MSKDIGLIDKTTYSYVLGGLMAHPGLLDKYTDIQERDFDYRVAQVIFRAILELRTTNGNAQIETAFSANSIETQISLHPNIYQPFTAHGGLNFLADCAEYGVEGASQFDGYYNRLKKFSVLRALKNAHYDISYFYKPEYATTKEESETVDRFNVASPTDILDYVEGNFQTLKNDFLQTSQADTSAAYHIKELIESFKNAPDIGPDLNGEWFNTVVRGARPGCFYIKAASTGTGKSRTSVFDACKLCYPVHWSAQQNAFVHDVDKEGRPRDSRKVLFIVTEMSNDEIQRIMLAYISGVNQETMCSARANPDEQRRIDKAGEIIEKYGNNFRIESISDPNLNNISSMIRRYAVVEKIQYIFFDYIHSTPSLLTQFAASKIREDVALMMFSNQLKQLAKDYNLFIFSATQVNADGIANNETSGFRNESCLRGSKAIADKADVAYVMSQVTPKDIQELNQHLIAYHDPDTNEQLAVSNRTPNMVLDIYKNRSGRKGIRIWIYLDLGTGERQDMYITWENNNPITEMIRNKPMGIYSEIIDPDWNK